MYTKAESLLFGVLVKLHFFSSLSLPYFRTLAIDALFEGGRMSVGAISVAYLLSKGLPVEKIAYLKIIQAIVLLAGELPTGLFADAYGSKKSLLLGAISTIIGLVFYITSNSLPFFCVAEFFTAIGLCFWSGAYETFSIEIASLNDNKGRLDRYFHQNQTINKTSVLFMGWVGGILASKNLVLSYYVGCSLILLSFILIYTSSIESVVHSVKIQELNPKKWILKTTNQLGETIKLVTGSPVLIPFIFANILIQFCIQPILHYWQPFFEGIDSTITPTHLGNVFAAYCATSAFFSFIYTYLIRFSWARSTAATIFLFSLFAIFNYLFSESSSFTQAIILFSLLQAFLALARTVLSIRLNEVIPHKKRASILSAVSLISRIGMMISLFFAGLLLKNGIPVGMLIKNFSILTVFISFLLVFGFLLKKRNSDR